MLQSSGQLHAKTRLDEKSILFCGGAAWRAQVYSLVLRLYRGHGVLSMSANLIGATAGERYE
jgi:hypothetical protein